MEGQASAGLRLKKPQQSGIKPVRTDRRALVTAYCDQFGRLRLSENDPTDHALAAIASILDKPESLSFPDASAAAEKPVERLAAEPSGPVEADGYSKTGPGPLQAIRFKWTVRRDDKGDYFVDETIGDSSSPISSGPMPSDAAIRFVDERESEARQRFEGIKREMAARDVSG